MLFSKSSVETAVIVGAVGATRSVVKARVAALLTLPATSSCVADSVLLPLSARSASTIAIVQSPLLSTVAVLSATPLSNPPTVTVAPTSPVPVKLKPASFSDLFRRLSVETASMVGTAIVTSVVSLSATASLLLPTASD